MNLVQKAIDALRGLLQGGRRRLPTDRGEPSPTRSEESLGGDSQLPGNAPRRNAGLTSPPSPAAKLPPRVATAPTTERRAPPVAAPDGGVCDLCTDRLPAGSSFVTAESIRQAVVNGFSISQVEWGPTYAVRSAMKAGAFRKLGLVDEGGAEARINADWMRRVASDDTDWATCPRCRAAIDKALAGKPTPQIAHLGKLYSGHPLDELRLMYLFPPSDKEALGTGAHLEHVIKETTGAHLEDVGARLGSNLKLADNDRLGRAIAETDDGGEELKRAQAEIQAEFPETSGSVYEFHWRMYAIGASGPYGALLFVYGPPLKSRQVPSDEQGTRGHGAAFAWYFMVVPGRPDNLTEYCTRLLKDFPHPAVNPNVIVDANGLSTSVHPVGYALDAIGKYLAPMQQVTRAATAHGAGDPVDFPDLMSDKWTIEHVEIRDNEGRKVMLIRAFDPKRIDRRQLPANYPWQAI